MATLDSIILDRANHPCELCSSTDNLDGYEVSPSDHADNLIAACDVCLAQLTGQDLDAKHWFCLKESIWSEVAAVQVTAFRMLHRLKSEPWAPEVLDQAYLDEDTLAWAQDGLDDDHGDRIKTLDSNGTALSDGDSVTLIKDLDVKGGGFTAKRGTLVKGIRLIEGDPDNIEGRVNKMSLVLKVKFLKKA
ncbi:MAG: PhnA domain protein [Rhodobacterales bacterium]|nr:PhnA domain protein [Rhodobacterales bacterium]